MAITNNNKTGIFPVLNLSCAGCAANVQKVLRQQQGVVAAEVNFANRTASVEYDASFTNAEELQKAVRQAGYDLVVTPDDDEEDKTWETAEKQRYRLLKIRTLIALILSAGLIALSMTSLSKESWAGYTEGMLATVILFVCGRTFFTDAYRKAKRRQMNMNTLVSLSTATAYLFSMFNLLHLRFFTEEGRYTGMLYFETSGVLIAFILAGRLLEERAKRKTSAALKKLAGLQAKTAAVVSSDGKVVETDVRNISVGDIIWTKAGEKIPVDGIVAEGHSCVDESMISGEAIAVEKKQGSCVFAGTVNQRGSFKFRVTKAGNETLLAQIIRLVRNAQNTKAPVEKTVDKIAGIFVPAVAAMALLSASMWLLFGGENAISHAFLAFVTVLIIACPCALGLATPAAVMVGMGKGAQHGILIKDMDSLETLRKVDVIVSDKTGTVTQGYPKVSAAKWTVAETEELRSILFGMEKASSHPLAEAITDIMPDVRPCEPLSLEVLPGKGVKTSVGENIFYAGNRRLFDGADNRSDVEEWITANENEGRSVVLFGTEKLVMALFAVADEIKASAQRAVEQLQASGLEVIMATGDNAAAAAAIARQAGIREFLAQALPEDKLHLIEKKQLEGKIVAMAGDGINDSAALAQANVGIAMGKGSDIAIETAGITIVSGDLQKIVTAIRLSRSTVATIRQNLFWAFFYNLTALPLAGGALYPFTGFLLHPMIAGAAMALSSVSVVLNSLRFNGFKASEA
ncbi:MAG: heavy metal translocating P-type ATPase [Tannerella sp.]|jgi:Cu2+-exporting ATPase|nr:heavy metal translocating P-type ATPase [Tannerella sp.]